MKKVVSEDKICNRVSSCGYLDCPHATGHNQEEACDIHICSRLFLNRECSCVDKSTIKAEAE